MYKLFVKTLLNMFLWLILLANLFMFFDIVSPLQVGGYVNSIDRTQYYFGVSSLINMFKSLPNSRLGQVATVLNSTLGTYSGFMSRVFNFGWSRIADSFSGIIVSFDEGNGITAIGHMISLIGSIFVSIGTTLATLLMGLVLPILFFTWVLFTILSIVEFIWTFNNGTFATPLPPSMLNTLFSGIVNTPLLDFAVWGV